MLNEKAEAYRFEIRTCRDRLRRAWELNLPKSEIGKLQETLAKASAGLRRMGLAEERKEGTLMKPRKSRKPRAKKPAEDGAPDDGARSAT